MNEASTAQGGRGVGQGRPIHGSKFGDEPGLETTTAVLCTATMGVIGRTRGEVRGAY